MGSYEENVAQTQIPLLELLLFIYFIYYIYFRIGLMHLPQILGLRFLFFKYCFSINKSVSQDLILMLVETDNRTVF